MLFLLTGSTQKLKLEKVHGALLFYVSPSSPPLQSRFTENAKILSKKFTTQENNTISRQNLLLLLKTQRNNNHFSASDWWENTKSSFKENVRTFSTISTSQESIRISRQKEDCETYTKKKTSNQKLNQ